MVESHRIDSWEPLTQRLIFTDGHSGLLRDRNWVPQPSSIGKVFRQGASEGVHDQWQRQNTLSLPTPKLATLSQAQILSYLHKVGIAILTCSPGREPEFQWDQWHP